MCSNIPGLSQLLTLFSDSAPVASPASSKEEKVESVAQKSLQSAQQELQEREKRVNHKTLRGIPNVGNSCYINASIQLVANSPRFLEKLLQEKEKEADEFQKYIFDFITKLHSEKVQSPAIGKGDAKGLLDKLVHLGWTTRSQKTKQRDAYDFLSFLLKKARVNHLFYGITAKEIVEKKSHELSQLLEEVQGKRKTAPFKEVKQAPDFVVVTIEGRFMGGSKNKETVSVNPSSIVTLGKEEKIPYVLSGVLVNPSTVARSGHYITFIPQKLQDETSWIQYNDSEAIPCATLDKENKELVEQHSYLYLYQKVELL